MEDALAVSGRQSPGQLHADPEHCGQREGAFLPKKGLERTVFVVGHHEKEGAVRGDADVENLDDVRMAGEFAHGALFSYEAGAVVGSDIGGQHFDGDSPTEGTLDAAIDHPESSAPDLLRILEPGRVQFCGDIAAHIALSIRQVDFIELVHRWLNPLCTSTLWRQVRGCSTTVASAFGAKSARERFMRTSNQCDPTPILIQCDSVLFPNSSGQQGWRQIPSGQPLPTPHSLEGRA